MSNKINHLNMIQEVINRMSKNSFSLKGWAVTLVSGIFALSAKDTNTVYFLIAYIPIFIFWILDSYYLLQEKLFRLLYDDVRKLNENQIDFNMDTSKFKNNIKNKYFHCLFSISEFIYLPLALTPVLVIVISKLVL